MTRQQTAPLPLAKILAMPKWHRSYTKETQTAVRKHYNKHRLPHVQLLGGERATLCRHHVHMCIVLRMLLHAALWPARLTRPRVWLVPRAETRHAQNPTRQTIT